LYNFTPLSQTVGGAPGINSDGAYPYAGLLLSGNTLYGTAERGGDWGFGTVFAVSTDGTGFTTLYSFTGFSDGGIPDAGLVLSGNTLYGTTSGDLYSAGTIFAVNTDGTGFTTLYSFGAFCSCDPYLTNSDGFLPYGELVLSGSTLYGTAYYGGSGAGGTVFAINTDGTGFTVLHSFNSVGANPVAGLVLSGGTLYGTTEWGGAMNRGIVFKLNTDGTGFTVLYDSMGTGSFGSLLLSGNVLYGATEWGGALDRGIVFKLNTDGSGFEALCNVAANNGLILYNNTLFGTTAGGGNSGPGTVFAVNTDGTGFTSLHSFAVDTDGLWPNAGLVLLGSTLYGTAIQGGSSSIPGVNAGSGTVFSLVAPPQLIPPQLTITPAVGNVILTWSTNFTGFSLQSTTNLISPTLWSSVSPDPVVVNGQYTVTNPISGARQFYRLSQ
jgi:uncharacterized repeat protein (TIGR03803 family)